jgi:hypothetical protein
VKALAVKMAQSVPAPAAVRSCQPRDYVGLPTLTFITLLHLADLPIAADTVHADWINPPGLDSPVVHDLGSTDETTRRRAAAQLLAAPAWMVYKVDMVSAPMAVGVKELRTGTVGASVIRYSKTGLPDCVEIFYFQNDEQKANFSIAKSDRALIDPAISKMLRDDLGEQYLSHAPKPTAPPAK